MGLKFFSSILTVPAIVHIHCRMGIEISHVDLRGARVEKFLSLSKLVYRNDPYYCARSDQAVIANLNREVFRDGQCILLASDGSQPLARVVARISPALRDVDGEPIGMLGFFEALNVPVAAEALFDEAIDFLISKAVGKIIGPIDGDTWHSYRMNAGPFDTPPFMMEPYNPAYYPTLWEEYGFTSLENYFSKRIDDVEKLAAQLQRVHQRVLSSGFTLRRIQPEKFQEELKLIYEISCDIFADNFLYTRIHVEDFITLYDGVKQIMDRDLVWFGYSPQGQPVGFAFMVPDFFEGVAAMRGQNNLLAKLRFLINRGKADAFNVKTVGVISKFRRSGLGGALFYEGYRAAIAKGYRKANHCLIKEGNPSDGMDRGLGRVMRQYVLYEYDRSAK